MTNRPLTRRLTLVLTLLLSLGVLVMALIGPAETLAQTRKLSCPTTAARVKAKRAGRTCTQSHKSKTKRHAKHKKKASKAPAKTTAVAAICEDGSAPTRGASGEFACTDGSEPICEDGATPTASHNGKSLLCPVAGESEESSAAEAECEEEGLECTGNTSAPSEQSCEASASEGSSFICEAEG
jgi:cobalamin biosynthesis protein CobT